MTVERANEGTAVESLQLVFAAQTDLIACLCKPWLFAC